MKDLGSDAWAARVTGTGVGLIALMLTWLIGNRLVGMFVPAPAGPTLAFATAIILGIVVAVVSSRRLLRTVRSTSTH